jgi:glyoxylase-like metal-dependent hydrolase (beta-lactamase superfamily II)
VVRFGHGHAPDHATLWSEDGEIVIGGDQLLPSISPNLGVYATEPDADPVAEWIDACRKLQPFATPRINWSCRATSCPSPACPTGCGR